MSVYVGVDPGLGGAIAFYTSLTRELRIWDTPTDWVTVNKKRRRALNLTGLARIFGQKIDYAGAVIESVHAMPTQGVSSSFTFGFVFGATRQCLVDHLIQTTLVEPATWKRALGLSSNKDEARAMAARKFPSYAHLFSRKKDDGRAEAALLALYGFLVEGK